MLKSGKKNSNSRVVRKQISERNKKPFLPPPPPPPPFKLNGRSLSELGNKINIRFSMVRHVIITITKILLPQTYVTLVLLPLTYVTLADFGYLV